MNQFKQINWPIRIDFCLGSGTIIIISTKYVYINRYFLDDRDQILGTINIFRTLFDENRWFLIVTGILNFHIIMRSMKTCRILVGRYMSCSWSMAEKGFSSRPFSFASLLSWKNTYKLIYDMYGIRYSVNDISEINLLGRNLVKQALG